MRTIFFALFALLVIGGPAIYIHLRATRAFKVSKQFRSILAAALVLNALLLFASRLLASWAPPGVVGLIGSVTLTIALATLVSAVLLGALELPLGALRGLQALRSKSPPPRRVIAPEPDPAIVPDISTAVRSSEPKVDLDRAQLPSRRDFVTQVAVGSALTVGASSALYGAIFGRHDYAIEEVVVKIPTLPKTLEGLTLVQLSDIHLGVFVGDNEIAAALSLVDDAKPDLVVLTGDLIDRDARYAESLGRLTRGLVERARFGVASAPGNHDYYAGIEPTLRALTKAGATVLRNQSRVVVPELKGLAMLGVDDVWAARMAPGKGPDLALALADHPPDHPRILLCHNPVYFPEAAPKIDLQLSGHTHGGQFNLGIRPADYVLRHGYVAGRHARGDATLYINRGFGTAGPPARLGSPPEVTRIVLVSG